MTPWVDIQLATSQPEVCPDLNQLTTWVRLALLPSTPEACELTLRFVDDEESQQLNASYRGKNQPTNVLSFPFDADIDLAAEGELTLLGDLVICVPQVLREAEAQQKQPLDHWAHLVIHGTLHLQGLDHQETLEAEAMETLETQLLAELGIADPYASPESNKQQVDSLEP
ncbi:probable rRNA maturation factor [Marinospirillum celere]|uniref:Endoribonuclease YbeY n=1 Tax=Marinospirillum celere TaxID=1122252 RepID=A0A1I1GRZ2_9GAMM|nr:rRNA maturation RNase YbeY [Marinospirillum celere]SFC12003.1 probable rRNA maturation factor [Marinospirillum celere]